MNMKNIQRGAYDGVVGGVVFGAMLIGVLSLLLSLTGCTTAISEHEPTFPSFKLETIDGPEFDSARLKGNVVLINFWATWCAPCRVEIPWFTEFKERYVDSGFEIVGVSLDPENKDEILRFQQELEINYPLVLSDGKIEEQAGGILGIPTTFLIDRDGQIVAKHVGLVSKATLQQAIETLL